jgi:hypothetical protein
MTDKANGSETAASPPRASNALRNKVIPKSEIERFLRESIQS